MAVLSQNLSKNARLFVEKLKKKYGLSDANLKPLIQKLQFKSPATQETYLIFFKKWLEAGGVFDDETAMKVLSEEGPNSVRTAYYALRFIYRAYDEDLGFSVSDIAPKGVRKHKEVMTKDEVIQLIRHVKENENPKVQMYFILSTVYGLRRIEMFRLEKSDIDLERRKFSVFTAKGGLPRDHLIPDELFEYFKAFKRTPKARYKHIQELNYLFDAVADRAGVQLRPRLGWHSIRRCLVTELMKTNLNILVVRDFLRWRPRESEIVLEYTIFNPEEVDRAVFSVHPFLREWL